MLTGIRNCFGEIYKASRSQKKLLSVLIDPDKFDENETAEFLGKLPSETTHIFVGGSTVEKGRTCEVVKTLKGISNLPVVLFPGDHTQISPYADAILFLSLISGRNPEYLIEQQVKSVNIIKQTSLEVIPTGYILIDGNSDSSVSQVSNTLPMSQSNIEAIVNTALAGQYSGKKLIYLEAGSGAQRPVSTEVIEAVKREIAIPLIVGGGIRSQNQLKNAYRAGADLVVIGTAFEEGSFRN